MGFSVSDDKIKFTGVLEEEIVRLCVENAGLCVLIVHPRRALSAAVKFYIELSDDTKRKYRLASNRYEVPFPNGSIIRFVGFTEGISGIARVPTIPINILITYGLKNVTIMRALFSRMGKYDKVSSNYVSSKITPLFIEDNYLFGGQEFYREYEHLLERCNAITLADDSYGGDDVIDERLEETEEGNEASALAEVYKSNKAFEKDMEEKKASGNKNNKPTGK